MNVKTYTTKQAAALLKVSESSFRKIASEQRKQGIEWRLLGAGKNGAAYWHAGAVDQYAKNRKTQASAKTAKPKTAKPQPKSKPMIQQKPVVRAEPEVKKPEASAEKEKAKSTNFEVYPNPKGNQKRASQAPASVAKPQADTGQVVAVLGRSDSPKVTRTEPHVLISLKSLETMKELLNNGKTNAVAWGDLLTEINSI